MIQSRFVSEHEYSKSTVSRRESAERQVVIGRRKVKTAGLGIQRTGMSTHRGRDARPDRQGAVAGFGDQSQRSITPTWDVEALVCCVEDDRIRLPVDRQVRCDDFAIG